MATWVLIANQDGVYALVSTEACIGVVEVTVRMLARGNAFLPLRTSLVLPEGKTLLGLMPM